MNEDTDITVKKLKILNGKPTNKVSDMNGHKMVNLYSDVISEYDPTEFNEELPSLWYLVLQGKHLVILAKLITRYQEIMQNNTHGSEQY